MGLFQLVQICFNFVSGPDTPGFLSNEGQFDQLLWALGCMIRTLGLSPFSRSFQMVWKAMCLARTLLRRNEMPVDEASLPEEPLLLVLCEPSPQWKTIFAIKEQPYARDLPRVLPMCVATLKEIHALARTQGVQLEAETVGTLEDCILLMVTIQRTLPEHDSQHVVLSEDSAGACNDNCLVPH